MPALVILALLLVGAWAVSRAFVRRLVAWRPRRRIARVLGSSAGEVTFARSALATEPGEFGISWPRGSARIGDPRGDGPDDDAEGFATAREKARSAPSRPEGTVTRPVLTATGQIPTGEVHWSPDPAPLPGARDVGISSPSGQIPAWEFPPETQRSQSADPITDTPLYAALAPRSDCVVSDDAWAIHVHGVRSSRRNALWCVPAAANAGFRSLVIAYRGAPDGPRSGRQAGMGYIEADDVAAAIEHAVTRGARRVVLVGWSMGASACLLAAERPDLADRIAGLVLVAPALSWRHIMRAGSARMRVPAWITTAVEALVQSPLARVVGMPAPVDLRALDWVTPPGRLRHPALVIGSRGDTNAPFALAEEFAAQNPDHITMHEVAPCRHGWEPNADPDEFREVVEGWLRRTS